jgi:imidazolonepropionase-like amidohydrolase
MQKAGYVVTLVTGGAGGTVTPGRTVVVGAGGTIERVGSAADAVVPSGYRRIDLTRHFVLAGLINAHAHLFSDGRPVPPILLEESTAAIVTKPARSPLGRRLFKRRAKAADPLDGFRAFVGPRMVVARGAVLDRPSVSRFAELDAHLDSF